MTFAGIQFTRLAPLDPPGCPRALNVTNLQKIGDLVRAIPWLYRRDLKFHPGPNDVGVIPGSYKFSRSAEDFNDENVIILHSPKLAEDYLVEFKRIFDQAGIVTAGRD
jgi:hypothetical protein